MRGMSLFFDQTEIPLMKGSYTLNYTDEETINKSEAGTKIRELIREGVPKISVSTYADDTWYKKFRTYKAKSSIAVGYYNPSTLLYSEFNGYITNFKFDLQWADVPADLVNPIVGESIWKVSFDIVSY